MTSFTANLDNTSSPSCLNEFLDTLGVQSFDKLLGSGRYGKVWRVNMGKEHLPKKIALKTINTDLVFKEKGDKEGESLALGLNSEHICKTYGLVIGGPQSHTYLTKTLSDSVYVHVVLMEFLEEYAVLESINIVSVQAILKITEGVLKGLQVLHGNSILHRDITPTNIMVRRVGYQTKIIDFSAATKIHPFMYKFAGIEKYTAPEVKIYRNWSDKADIYSIGAIFIEMGENRDMKKYLSLREGLTKKDPVMRFSATEALQSIFLKV